MAAAFKPVNTVTGQPYDLPATPTSYETVAASQTAQVLGGSGAIGDVLAGLLIIPGSVSPGVVTILDGSTSINILPGGTTSLTELRPFYVRLDLRSTTGPWKVTTGANVTAIASGNFT